MITGSSIYWTIFITMLKISSTTFGGGIVIVPLMKEHFVDRLGLIDENEILDLTAIAQSCPGSLGVNAAVLIGYKIARLPGGLLAVLGSILPPITIISILSLFYTLVKDNSFVRLFIDGMLCGVVAMILHVVLNMISKMDKHPVSILILILSFVMNYYLRYHVLFIMSMAATFMILKDFWQRRSAT